MPERNDKNHWMRFLLFIGILLAMVELLNIIPKQISHEKNGNFWPYFYQETPENSLDIVFMGNSHSKTTFIPEIFDKLLGTKSVHVNTSGESVFQTVYEYREVLRYQKPRLVILETFPIYDGLDQEEIKPWNFSFFYSMPFSLRKYIYGSHFFSNMDLLKFYFPFISNHTNWKDPQVLFSRVKDEAVFIKEKIAAEWHIDLPHQGYENYLVSLPQQPKYQKLMIERNDCPIPDFEDRLRTTEEILTISQDHESELLLIEAPQYINLYANCRPQVIDLTQQYGIPHHTLLENRYVSPLWFGDDQHMTQFGAIIASVETVKMLAEKLDIRLNQELLARYESYYFIDYTLIQEGDTVTLSLIPENIEKIKDLDFEWYVSLNNEIFLDYEELAANELKFSLPEPTGAYFIHVVIHDTMIHYYLRGGFSLVLE